MRLRVARLSSVPSPVQTIDAIWRGFPLFVQRLHLRTLLWLCLFELAFYFAYRSGMSFSQVAASPFWFPDSILLCALLVARPGLWWILVLLPLPVRLFSDVAAGIPTWFLLTTFAIDSAKALAAALALRGFAGRSFRLQSVREIAAFFLVAVLLVPALSAFLGAAARAALGRDYWPSWEQWFLGDALAQMVVTPVLFHWGLVFPLKAWPRGARRAEAAILAVLLVVAGYMATNTGPSSVDFAGARFYLPIPFMFWAAFRFGMRGASGAVGVMAILAVHGALHGRGPFSDLSPADITLALQNFLLLRSAPLYLVAAVIMQREAVEARLRESEDRFRNIANTAPVLLWISGRDALCEFVNQGWLEFTGRPLADVTGKGWLRDVHADDMHHVLEAYGAAFDARRPFELEYRLRRHDGHYRWVVHKGALRRAANGDFLGYIGSAIDITDRRQAEENARLLSHAQRLVVMGELSAAIAHEVRQPLSAILSNADAAAMLLKSTHPPLDEIREIVSDIRADDLRANEIVGRIREFLRTEAAPAQPIDVNAAISDALGFVAGDARRRRIQIRTELADRLPAVPADRTQLQQVLVNLFVNAMDAMESTPEPARCLTVRTALSGTAGIEIAVADRGHGIRPGALERLFEPFVTTKNAGKNAGMGLGLSIARSIVQTHQGRIWADNNRDGGATFHVTLPATPGSGK
ncbi:MAG TPA: ATP-binding protein [Dongiaceae bacterium]|nr:ATP-binding protein [Dongiaceae bacterium]